MGTDAFENLRLELRRGSLILAVLAERPLYGYLVQKRLREASGNMVRMQAGTLYPLLRRLETQGLLVSQWREEDKRNKRFYQLSPEGTRILEQLSAEWRAINGSLEQIL